MERDRSPNPWGPWKKAASVRWLIGSSAMLFLALLPFSSYVVAVPFVRDEWGIGNAEGAFVFSAYLIGAALSSLLVVPLGDRFPTGPLIALSITLSVAAHLLFPAVAREIATASFLRALAGAGHAGAYVLGIRMVTERFPLAHRGRAVGLFVSFGYAGTTVSYVLMGAALSFFGTWREAYAALALVALTSVPLAWWLGRDRPTDTKTTPESRGRLEVSVLRERPIALVTTAYSLHAAELYVARLWFPLLLGFALEGAGLGSEAAASRAASLSGLMFTLGIPAVFLGGALSDRVGRANAAAWIFAVSGASSLAAGWLAGFPGLLVGLGFLYGFATAADSAIYTTAAVELASESRVGSAQAVQSFIGFVVGGLAPIVAGAILDWAGPHGWTLAFAFNAALALPAIACLVALGGFEKRQ